MLWIGFGGTIFASYYLLLYGMPLQRICVVGFLCSQCQFKPFSRLARHGLSRPQALHGYHATRLSRLPVIMPPGYHAFRIIAPRAITLHHVIFSGQRLRRHWLYISRRAPQAQIHSTRTSQFDPACALSNENTRALSFNNLRASSLKKLRSLILALSVQSVC